MTKPPTATASNTASLVRRLWRDWMRPHAGRLAAALTAMAVVAGTTAAYPVLIKWVIEMFAAHDQRIQWLMPAIVLAITVARGLGLYFQAVLANAAVFPVIAELQKAMFGHLLRADLARITSEPVGQLVSRFTNDAGVVRNAMTQAAQNLVRDILTVVALVGSMFYLDWALSLIVLVVYPVAAIPIIQIGQRLRKVSKSTQAHMGDMTALLDESLSGARMVKSYRLEAYESARAARAFEKAYGLFMSMVRSRARLDPILEVLGGIAIIGVISFGFWRATTGGQTVGDLIGFISAVLFGAQPVRAIGNLNAVLQEGLAAAQRIFDVLDEEPKVKEAQDAPNLIKVAGRIEFRNVTFAYPDGSAALHNVSLTVEPGQTVALVGPSGAGKSTLFNLIPRFFDPSDGQILIDGQNIAGVSLASLRDAIGLVSQDVILFDDTIEANIAFGRPGADRGAIEQAARAAAAHDFITRLDQGYEGPAGPKGARLSGGERQRVALARAFLKDAPILLLDEATSALDAQSEKLVQDALAALARGRTTLVIAHRLATVRDADVILVMDGGRIVEQGSHDSLQAQGGLYAELCRLQLKPDA